MTEAFHFIEVGSTPPRQQDLWPSIIVPRRAIEAEAERLVNIALPATGVRASAISHPHSDGPVPAFTPGIDVTLHVLKPGEQTAPIARNSTIVDMCIGGEGVAMIGSRSFGLKQFDVWNTPSLEPYRYRNDGRDLFVRLSYSNAPLLQKLEVHYVDEHPNLDAGTKAAPATQPSMTTRARDLAEVIALGSDGAQLLGYEYLIDIDTVDSKALVWRWADVSPHLEKVYTRDINYTGRHLYVLYNPATERRIGTTHCFFATIAKYPPNKIDQPHRHTSAAINYYFIGHGKSAVMGERMEWDAGDLHLSAPGWAVHNHGSREQGFCALTVQDHPLHIAMESLVWQETLKSAILKLGSQKGFETNLGSLRAA